jgi:hypothetical protein
VLDAAPFTAIANAAGFCRCNRIDEQLHLTTEGAEDTEDYGGRAIIAVLLRFPRNESTSIY